MATFCSCRWPVTMRSMPALRAMSSSKWDLGFRVRGLRFRVGLESRGPLGKLFKNSCRSVIREIVKDMIFHDGHSGNRSLDQEAYEGF